MEMDRLDQLRDLINAKQWDKASDLYRQLQEELPDSVYLLLLGSLLAYFKRDLYRARDLAQAALDRFSPAEPVTLLGRARYQLGMVSRELGDTHVAVEQLQLFLEELSTCYPTMRMAEGNARHELALTLRQRGDLYGALTGYEEAIVCYQRDGLPSQLCKALQNKSWLLCHIGLAHEARTALAAADALLDSTEARIHQTLGEAFVAQLEGRYGEAVEGCQSIFRRAEQEPAVGLEEQAQAAWIAGRIALIQQNLDTAAVLADLALDYATQSKESRLMADASNLRREVLMRKQEGA